MDANPHSWREHRFGLSPERWSFLRDKVIWITGSGTGFGQAMAVGAAAAGARVILSGRDSKKLEATLKMMESFGIPSANAFVLPLDLLNYAEIDRA
jgi:NADP-dependent 3-hydroxy acid dehydrogenase YdfG